MTSQETTQPTPTEPDLDTILIHDVRRADGDVDALAGRVLALLEEGKNLVDLSKHDTRGTTIHLRACTHGANRQ